MSDVWRTWRIVASTRDPGGISLIWSQTLWSQPITSTPSSRETTITTRRTPNQAPIFMNRRLRDGSQNGVTSSTALAISWVPLERSSA